MFVPDEQVTADVLKSSLEGLLQKARSQFTTLPKAKVKEVVSLEEMMDNLSKRIQTSLSMSFRDFSQMGKVDKVEVVVSFLAMLELVKQGALSVVQQGTFQDIELSATGVSAPKYD